MIKTLLKKIRYFFETIAVVVGMSLFKIIGVNAASNLGSFLAGFIGKRISVNKLAKNNIANAIPQKKGEIDDIIDGMWDNLGRICGEFVHICKMSKEDIGKLVKIDKVTKDNLKGIKETSRGGIIFSGHIGNWELGPKFFLSQGFNVKTVYRPLNNEAVDKVTSQIRNVGLIAKNTKGNKEIISEIKKGNYIIILVDQKSSEGIEVPFFHDNALTTSSIARLAIKYNVPLIPARSIRVDKKFKFKIEVDKPLVLNKDISDLESQIFDLTKKVNKKLESWINEFPAQWFWVHNRWKK